MPEKTEDLPAMTGPGVEKLNLPSINKLIETYEKKKEARCKVSPAEITAKGELLDALHKSREKLPVNGDGNHFYRYEGVDYVLEESLRRRKVAGDAGDED